MDCDSMQTSPKASSFLTEWFRVTIVHYTGSFPAQNIPSRSALTSCIPNFHADQCCNYSVKDSRHVFLFPPLANHQHYESGPLSWYSASRNPIKNIVIIITWLGSPEECLQTQQLGFSICSITLHMMQMVIILAIRSCLHIHLPRMELSM